MEKLRHQLSKLEPIIFTPKAFKPEEPICVTAGDVYRVIIECYPEYLKTNKLLHNEISDLQQTIFSNGLESIRQLCLEAAEMLLDIAIITEELAEA